MADQERKEITMTEPIHSAYVSSAHGTPKLCEFLSHMTKVEGWEDMTVKVSFVSMKQPAPYVMGKLWHLWECWISPGCTIEVLR